MFSLLRSQITRPLSLSVYWLPKRSQVTTATAKPFDSIPGPVCLPLIGTGWVILKTSLHPVRMHRTLHKDYGDIVLLRKVAGLGDCVVLFDLHDVEMMLRNEGPWPRREAFHSLSQYRTKMRPEIFGNVGGLLTSEGQDWAEFRNKVNPILLQPRTALQYINAINNVADDFLERTKELLALSQNRETPADYLDHLHMWALESIGVVALDMRLGCLSTPSSSESSKMGKYMLDIFKMSYTLDFTPLGAICKKFNLPIWRRYIEYQDFFTQKTLKLIEEAILRIESDSHYERKSELEKSAFEKFQTKGKLLALVMTLDMLAAGIDTTGKVSGAVLYFLAKHPEKQVKLRNAIKELLPDESHNQVTKEVLMDLPYLRAIIKEAMRFAPVASGTLRQMTKDIMLGGYHIPSGTSIIVPQVYFSLDERYFEEPLEFRPERWLRNDPQSELKQINPFASLPFGFGPRSCIGRRVANLEIEVLITKIVKDYELKWHHKPMTFDQDFLYGIRDPLRIEMNPIGQTS